MSAILPEQKQAPEIYVPGGEHGPNHPGYSGLLGWLTTVDHKKIGLMYFIFAVAMAVLGGAFAGVIRGQLSMGPGKDLVTPDFYNQMIGMHASVMLFFVLIPGFAAFGNYIVPILIGARDMAFPKLNAFAFWLLIPSAAMMVTSFWFGSMGAGWTAYPPLTSAQYSPNRGVDFWIFGVHLAGMSSILGAINFITTISNMRAPGMKWFKMPLFVWATLVTSWLQLIGTPVLAGALTMLLTDRMFGTGFFNPAKGGDALLYQHLFWFYSHPAVYIMILPGFGAISHILASFSGKQVFGYKGMVYAVAMIGILGFLVWGHHMFTTGMAPWLRNFFGFMTSLIAIPTGVKIFSWLATIWGGSIRFTTSMKFALAFIATFTCGGISGLFLANIPFDIQVHDSYFVVAHFHYVMVGGSIMSLFSMTYYWFPKMTGRYLSEKLGNIVFWLFFIGLNWTFLPMHWVGLAGMARRIHHYRGEFTEWNQFVSFGYLFTTAALALFIFDMVYSVAKRPKTSPADSWGVNETQKTLEWETTSPPPAHNFDRTPRIA